MLELKHLCCAVSSGEEAREIIDDVSLTLPDGDLLVLLDGARIASIPALTANGTGARLIHDAAIGKIAGDRLLKLQTPGLTAEEAEERILKGSLA